MTSKFFKSELVRGDIQEMMELQQICFKYAMSFPLLNREKKLEYLEALQMMLEKQEIMYARMQLSDDPEAKTVLENMKQGIVMMGADPNKDIKTMFNELREKVEFMLEETQKST
jgi:hypothetical protein|tara:strand:- start:67 stop:408 length:342 start_codon:yes stop_codon:yes gene_type:complete